MLPYIFIYLFAIFYSYKEIFFRENIYVFKLFLSFLLFFIAFRYQTGSDWQSYYERMENLRNAPAIEIFDDDVFYGAINWVGANYFNSIYFVNTICTLIILISLP